MLDARRATLAATSLPRRAARRRARDLAGRGRRRRGDGRCAGVPKRARASRRQNVGSLADSEGNGRGANNKKCPFAGEKLEAAIGVEPMMEVLQSSGGSDGPCALAWEGAARSKIRREFAAGRCSVVLRRGQASCRHCVGSPAPPVGAATIAAERSAPSRGSRLDCVTAGTLSDQTTPASKRT